MNSHGQNHRYEVASAISLGRRDHQEDAMAVDFPKGSEFGYVVLADGMGGHAAGDVASKLVVTEVYSDLKLQSGNPGQFERRLTQILQESASSANDCVKEHTATVPSAAGMGSTLVAPVLMEDRLYWISIGDSPLFLCRNGCLTRLNENHSMAAQIDYMADSGLLSEDERLNHPDRHCLSSGLAGQKINLIDCPGTPIRLEPDDLIVVATDGLLFLTDTKIADILRQNQHKGCAEMADALLAAIELLADPDQDNVAFTIIAYNTRPELRAKKCPIETEDNILVVAPNEHHPAKIEIINYVFLNGSLVNESKE